MLPMLIAIIAGSIGGELSPSAPIPSATQEASSRPAQDVADRHALKQRRDAKRIQALRDLKQRYSLNLQDLAKNLRDKVIKLSIDGIAVPGRISTKEIELVELIKEQTRLHNSFAEVRADLERHKERLAKGQNDPLIIRQVDQDQRIDRYLQQLDEIELKLAEMADEGDNPTDLARLKKRKAALAKKIEGRRSELLTNLHAARTDELEARLDSIQQRSKGLNDPVNQAKQDLGDLTYQLTQYLSAKEEERQLRETLRRVSRQLDYLESLEDMGDDPKWAEIMRNVHDPSFDKVQEP